MPAQPGDQFQPKATEWNNAVAAGEAFQAGRLPLADATPDARVRPAATVFVRNDTDADRVAGDVLAIGAPAQSVAAFPRTVNTQPILAGTVPDTATAPAAVLLDDVPKGHVGRAAVTGVCVAKVAVADPAHRFASPAAGSTALASQAGVGPVALLGPPGATGTRLAAVRLGGGGGAGSDWTPGKVMSGTNSSGYVVRRLKQTGPAAFAEFTPTEEVTAYREPTNPGVPLPNIPAGETVQYRLSPDGSGLYECTPWGGQLQETVRVIIPRVTGGSLTVISSGCDSGGRPVFTGSLSLVYQDYTLEIIQAARDLTVTSASYYPTPAT